MVSLGAHGPSGRRSLERVPVTAHAAVVEVRGLGKVFRRRGEPVHALCDVSFSIGRGEAVGFLGPNGAGKTTTVRIVLGLRRPTSGDVRVAARRVGFVLDVPSLYPQLTLERNLDFYGELLGLGAEAWRERISELGLSDLTRVRVGELSLGMRKRAELARALLGDPDLLLLDEPTSGLDPQAQEAFRRVLRAEVERGVSILMTSHDLFNVQKVCDRFLLIREGKIAADEAAGGRDASELERLYLGAMGGGA